MLTGPDDGPGRELPSLLLDESAVAQVHELIKQWFAMPEDAAQRWGDAVATHSCGAATSCLLGIAQRDPAKLDDLHQRLARARDAAAAEAGLRDCGLGRTKKPSKWAHREGFSMSSATHSVHRGGVVCGAAQGARGGDSRGCGARSAPCSA